MTPAEVARMIGQRHRSRRVSLVPRTAALELIQDELQIRGAEAGFRPLTPAESREAWIAYIAGYGSTVSTEKSA